jgi:transposase
MTPRDDQQASVLRKLATGEWKWGQALIERDRLRPTRWYVRLSYTRLVSKRKEGIYAAINRGIKSFITAVTATGESWIYDGEDIVAYLKQVQRRRREYQYASKASGRNGHGRKRILRPTGYLEGKAERWRQTRCQVIARRLAQWLADRNVKHVFIEDFTGIRDGVPEKLEGGKFVWNLIQEWPYFQLETRLVNCLKEYGIETTSRGCAWISQRCPECGYICAENRDLKRWVLKCVKCKWKKHLDIAASINNLIDGTKELEKIKVE